MEGRALLFIFGFISIKGTYLPGAFAPGEPEPRFNVCNHMATQRCS